MYVCVCACVYNVRVWPRVPEILRDSSSCVHFRRPVCSCVVEIIPQRRHLKGLIVADGNIFQVVEAVISDGTGALHVVPRRGRISRSARLSHRTVHVRVGRDEAAYGIGGVFWEPE